MTVLIGRGYYGEKGLVEIGILTECPICHRKQFGGQKQAKNEGFGVE
jgi:hypothetical protein